VKSYLVNMLRCSDGSFYVGVTNNLEYRVAQHETGFDRKCYTFKRRPIKLVHSSEFYEIADAICWEKQLKGWSRAKKEALVRNDWPSVVRLSRNYGERFGHPSTGSG
jgi:putative endonuclease